MRHIFLLALSISSLRASDQSCPWLNAATAAGYLGGPVTAEFIKKSADGSCLFVRQDHSPPVSSLRIEVSTLRDPAKDFASYAAQCGPDLRPVMAIGNEAVACRVDPTDGHIISELRSRVREHAFLVRIDSKDPGRDQNAIRETVLKIAEQVAGSLF